ncbi:MAG: HipA domain-containing protein [Alphaproteobacteria bacterium]|nr:HipA domain-containing protein [Alphaproteobacteria bacterium]
MNEERCLIVTRFDRTENYKKLRMEDFAQILSKKSDQKYSSSYEECAGVIKKHSSRPALDLQEFYKRMIANIIIGNCDAHLKNFSLLETKDGLRLSPTYDVLNSIMYKNLGTELALELNGKKYVYDDVDQELLVQFGHNIGLTSNDIHLIFSEVAKKVKIANKLLQSPVPDEFRERFKEIVEGTCHRLLKK